MNKKKDRLLILGFDGTSPDLLERWMEEGQLPNIKALVSNGVYGRLESVPNMSSAPAWTSFATGKNPGKHGIISFTERNHENYRYTYVNGTHRRAQTFWSMLCGDRVGCIINVPMTFPSESINGCMISGLDAPGSDSPGVCKPDGLIKEMVTSNGPFRLTANLTSLLRKTGRWDKGAERLLETMDMRYKHMSYLMDKYDWDLFTVVFGETDGAHHFYWKFLDPSHPAYDPTEAERFGDVILDVYRKMDEIVGKFVEQNPDVTILMVSDHGGAVNTRGAQVLSDWLEGMGLMVRRQDSWFNPRHVAGKGIKKVAGVGYRLGNKYISAPTRLKIARALPGLSGKVESAVRLGDIDWSRTKVFCDGVQDDLWINLEGRDPLGIVPQSEYEGLCDMIVEELRNAVDVKTGERVVDLVWRRDDVYKGEYVELAADISVRWNIGAVVNGLQTKSSPSGRLPVELTWPVETPSGSHRLEGILIASGPRIAQGAKVKEARLMDIAPTVLYSFGEEIPEDYDGRVITGIFDQSYLSANPPRYGGASHEIAAQEDVYTEEDSAVIEQRLRDLGYI